MSSAYQTRNQGYKHTPRDDVHTSHDNDRTTHQEQPVIGRTADNRTVRYMKENAIESSKKLGHLMMQIGGVAGLSMGFTFFRLLCEQAEEKPQYGGFSQNMAVLMFAATFIASTYITGLLLGGLAGLVVGAAVGGLHGVAKATAENVKEYVTGAPQPG